MVLLSTLWFQGWLFLAEAQCWTDLGNTHEETMLAKLVLISSGVLGHCKPPNQSLTEQSKEVYLIPCPNLPVLQYFMKLHGRSG